MIIAKCPECGFEHSHPEPEPPITAVRWCVLDTRDCEPYEGWKIWEAEMQLNGERWYIPKSDSWPPRPYRCDVSFATREEVYKYVFDVLNEELNEKQQAITAMLDEYAAAPEAVKQ